jgi:hypothetical protein
MSHSQTVHKQNYYDIWNKMSDEAIRYMRAYYGNKRPGNVVKMGDKDHTAKSRGSTLSTTWMYDKAALKWKSSGDDLRPLEDVETGATLLINGHGCAGSPKLASGAPGGTVRISADELTAMVKDDGLPETHVYIRLLACSGGEDGAAIESGKFNDARNFASLFAYLLGRTHKQIRVGGYAGLINETYDKGVTSTMYPREHAKYVSVVWYNCDGTLIAKKEAAG